MYEQNAQEFLPADNSREMELRRRSRTSSEPAAQSTPQPSRRPPHVTVSMDSSLHHDTTPQATPEAGHLEQLLARMADTLSAAMSRAATPIQPQQRPIPLQKFRGMEHESAVRFLDKMEEHFQANRITDSTTKLQMAVEQLDGDARRWYEPYKYLISQYSTFADRLRARYDSIESLTQATTKLYGEKQGPRESAAVFITRKNCLFQRVDPNKSEAIKTSIVLEQLRPDVRSRLRGLQIQTLEELVDIANQIENDLGEMPANPNRTTPNNAERRPAENVAAPIQGPNQPSRGTGPSTPCRFCPGTMWHYHRDCPNNPYQQRQQQAGPSRAEPSWRNNQRQPQQSNNGAARNRGAINQAAEVLTPENQQRAADAAGRQSTAQPATATPQ